MLAPKLLATCSSGLANKGQKPQMALVCSLLISGAITAGRALCSLVLAGITQEAARGCSELIIDACIHFLGLL